MKKIIYTLLLSLPASVFAQLGVGTTTPDASAQLDVTSTTKGVLFPRLTTTQRDAISNPATGLMIYNTTVNCLQLYSGGAWNCLSQAGSAFFNFNCTSTSPSINVTTGTASTGTVSIPITSVTAPGFVNVSANATSGFSSAGSNSAITTSSTQIPGFPWSYDGSGTYSQTENAVNVPLNSASAGGTCNLLAKVYNPAASNGTSAATYAVSCNRIKTQFPSSADGIYWVDPDSVLTSFSPMQVYCDMTTDGGGWTLLSVNGNTSYSATSTATLTNPTQGGWLPRSTVMGLANNATTVQLRSGNSAGSYANKAVSANSLAIAALQNADNTVGGAGTWHNGAVFNTVTGSWCWTVVCGIGAATTGWPVMYHSCGSIPCVHWWVNSFPNRISGGDNWASTWIR